MTMELWSRLVELAQNAGLMSKGYAWILTQGLSSVIDPKSLDISAKGYMDGALGVSPMIFSDIEKVFSLVEKLSKYDKILSLYCLWAYDTITALASAVEKAVLVNPTFRYRNGSRVDVTDVGTPSETGPKLREAIQDANFPGLSGNFSLKKGQLESSEVVVYNVKGQEETTIGYWSPEKGFHSLSVVDQPAAKLKLKDPTWPGNTTDRPPKLKIGVPKTHFPEFVNVSVQGQQNISATGFAIDVFNKVVDVLPFNLSYEFVPVNNTNGELTPSSYDDLLCDITNKNVDVDVIIGDITIIMNRTDCVDFTFPYLDSSVSVVVKVRSDSKNGWILLKPFDRILWLILVGIFVVATVVVIILERKTQNDAESKFKHFIRNPFLIYMSDADFLKSGASKWVVVVVTFLLSIALQTYTANLTSFFTERTTAKPSPWKDVQEIIRNNRSVGYQNDSWVRGLLINQIGLRDYQLKPLGSREEYKEALSNIAKNHVDAIFDETPYLMLLLSDCSDCKMTGPIYKTGGFAFAFPKNSTLVSRFSAAILKVTQNVTLFRDMKKIISLPITTDRSEYKSDIETRSLTKDDFGVLFKIVYSVLALFFCILIIKVPPIARWLSPIYLLLSGWVRSLSLWLHKKLVSFRSVSGGGVILISS